MQNTDNNTKENIVENTVENIDNNVVMECNICAETYNKSTRKPIECIYCHYTSCLKCNKIYILDLL